MQIHNTDFPFYTFYNLDRFSQIRHFVTWCGKGDDTDVNLRTPKGAENRIKLAKSVGFNIDNLVTGEQTHSLNIATVTAEHAGMGSLDIDSRIPCTDAIITNERGLCLMVLTADCVPIILYDGSTNSCAAIHAGWRGTANGLTTLTVNRMKTEYGIDPANLVAAIGPCIGSCCMEVGEDVAEQFIHYPEAIVRHQEWSRPHIDLVKANKIQLLLSGLTDANIETANICTKCNPSTFFSHRHNNTLGRIGTGIVLW